MQLMSLRVGLEPSMPLPLSIEPGTCFSNHAGCIEYPPTVSELTPGWPVTKSLMLWPIQVVSEDQLPFAGLPRRISTNQQGA